MALHRDILLGVLAMIGERNLIRHAATLISPENGMMMHSRCGVKRLTFPLGTPILPLFLSVADLPF
jgi:hypothetical protein